MSVPQTCVNTVIFGGEKKGGLERLRSAQKVELCVCFESKIQANFCSKSPVVICSGKWYCTVGVLEGVNSGVLCVIGCEGRREGDKESLRFQAEEDSRWLLRLQNSASQRRPIKVIPVQQQLPVPPLSLGEPPIMTAEPPEAAKQPNLRPRIVRYKEIHSWPRYCMSVRGTNIYSPIGDTCE